MGLAPVFVNPDGTPAGYDPRMDMAIYAPQQAGVQPLPEGFAPVMAPVKSPYSLECILGRGVGIFTSSGRVGNTRRLSGVWSHVYPLHLPLSPLNRMASFADGNTARTPSGSLWYGRCLL